MGAESKVFSHSEISAHNTAEDCWVIINAKVYNVTNYLNEHPGGDDVLLANAGKDASEEFEDIGHGSAARLMLDEFYVGEVDPSVKPIMEATSMPPSFVEDAKHKQLENSNKFMYFLIAIAIIALGMGIQFINLVN